MVFHRTREQLRTPVVQPPCLPGLARRRPGRTGGSHGLRTFPYHRSESCCADETVHPSSRLVFRLLRVAFALDVRRQGSGNAWDD